MATFGVLLFRREEKTVSTLSRREQGGEPSTMFSRMDRLFDEWMRSLPLRRPFGLGGDWPGDEMIRVDEFRDGDTQVVRAELAGIDPDKDVEITVNDGTLQINAQRRVEKTTEDKGYTRHELRYGSFTRTLPLPDGASESDITATYKDGILEIRVPVKEPPATTAPTKIAITKG
jgi:HSP20 family protein